MALASREEPDQTRRPVRVQQAQATIILGKARALHVRDHTHTYCVGFTLNRVSFSFSDTAHEFRRRITSRVFRQDDIWKTRAIAASPC